MSCASRAYRSSDPVYEAPASASAYRVVLRRLGEKIIVRLSQENPIGTIIIERQIVLANIEEMIPAAPRLVDALVHNKPINATVDMETVTEQEARELRKISGESLWTMGIFGRFIPGTDVSAEPGFEFGWSYQTPSYAVGTEFRYSGPDDDDDATNTIAFFSWSIGGRYFFNKRNISPYVGGGLAVVDASYKTKVRKRERNWPSFIGEDEEWFGDEWGEYYDDYESEDDSGLGAYGIVGIEALRLTESRLKLELRIDRPFFTLESQDIMPITFGIGDEWGEYYDDYESEDDSGLGAYGIVGIEALRLTESRLKLELRIDRPIQLRLESQDIMPITFGSFSRNYIPGGCLF